MVTFIWPPEVQWPPPAHILQNYDVVAPGGAVLSLHRASEMEERMTQPFLALITPLSGEPPGYWGGVAPPYPDNGLPVPPTVWPPEPIAPLPPDLESVVVVAVHKPGQDWEVKTYPVAPSQGLPEVDPRGRR